MQKKKDIFVNLINTLSYSIKEYYNVTKNINKNENILLNSCKNEINNLKSIINIILKEGIINNNAKLYNNAINKLEDILKKLELNIIYNPKNVFFFGRQNFS